MEHVITVGDVLGAICVLLLLGAGFCVYCVVAVNRGWVG